MESVRTVFDCGRRACYGFGVFSQLRVAQGTVTVQRHRQLRDLRSHTPLRQAPQGSIVLRHGILPSSCLETRIAFRLEVPARLQLGLDIDRSGGVKIEATVGIELENGRRWRRGWRR